MQRFIVIVGLALCALLVDGSAKPPAECARCSRRECRDSSSCYSGCVCVKFGRERRGVCGSID